MVQGVVPFALPYLNNIRDYAAEYFSSEQGPASAAGRHLNEVGEEWQYYLPELYGCDAEEFYTTQIGDPGMAITPEERSIRDGEVWNNDLVRYGELKKAVAYAEAHQYLRKDDHGSYELILILNRTEELKGRIEDKLRENQTEGYTWIDAMDDIAAEDHTPVYRTLSVAAQVRNGKLQTLQGNDPKAAHERRNIERIFRANMSLYRLIVGLKKEYEESRFFKDPGQTDLIGQ